MPAWDEFWQSVSVFQAAAWVIGILAIIAFFVKGWPKIRAFVRLVDALGELPQFMVDTKTKIDDIHHEVHYNNGSSVKDAIARLEKAAGTAPPRRRAPKKTTPETTKESA